MRNEKDLSDSQVLGDDVNVDVGATLIWQTVGLPTRRSSH
jgi:hypothetical protein